MYPYEYGNAVLNTSAVKCKAFPLVIRSLLVLDVARSSD